LADSGSDMKQGGGRGAVLPVIAAIIIAAAFAFFTLDTIENTSVTVDEFARIPASASYLETGDLRIDSVGTPPLTRLLIGLPFAGLEPEIPRGKGWNSGNMWMFGWEFMMANRDSYLDMARRARRAVAICGLALGLLVFAAGARLFGWWGGAAAMGALLLNPNFIAHSSVAGSDVPMALACALSFVLLFIWYEKGRARFAAASGAALGLALLVKYNAAVFFPALLLVLIAGMVSHAKRAGAARAAWRAVAALALIVVTAAVVVNLGYGFQGSGDMVGGYNFTSPVMKSLSRVLPAGAPVPAPGEFIRQVDANLAPPEKQNFYYYFMGEISARGWPEYYLVAEAVKEPIALLVLYLLALVAVVAGRRREALLFAVPYAVFMVVFSLLLRKDMGIRYLMPGIACMTVFAAAAVSMPRARLVAALLLAWMLAAAATAHPNHIAYFNEAAGGPAGGHRYLADSNLDWGQNLPALAAYMNEENIDRVYLAHFGFVDPGLYGVDYFTAPCKPAAGVFAVSPEYYYGLFPFNHVFGCFDFLRDRPPDGVVANTYYIYRIDDTK